MALKVFETLDTFDTEFSADSVEWCPIKPFKSIFACGTYQLAPDQDKKATTNSNKRIGRIYLFDVTRGGKLKLLQQLELSAVLDMKWAHVKLHDKVILGVVNSAGYLQIYELTSGDKESLKLVVEIRVGEDFADTLALSLDWCTGRWKNDDDGDAKIVVSDSKGSISVFSLCDGKLQKVISWSAHGFEAWISAFDYWDTNIVYTGGDDCKFQRFDIRNASGPVGVNRVHGAGVTSLHSNSQREFYLASGSYDEILRLWDTRNFRRPVSEINLAGGIWRLKWDPHAYRYLYAACMYNGFRILDCKTIDAPVIIAEYMEHGSISYGCDWSLLTGSEISEREIFNKNQGDVALTGTCSFYDHTLKISVVHL